MKRPAPAEFTPRVRGKIIHAIAEAGEYRGKLKRQEFAIFRGLDGIILLLREGKRWRAFRALNVWDACDLIERGMRRGQYEAERAEAKAST